MEILSYGQKATVFSHKKWKLSNAWFKVYFFFAILQVKPDLCIMNSTKLCQTRHLHSQPINQFVIMTLLFLMYHLDSSR